VTTDDDIAKLSQLCRELVVPDLEAQTAERIARRARDQLGKGPDPRRFIEPIVAAAIVIPYAAWVIIAVLQALR